jgi:hypothetical protein
MFISLATKDNIYILKNALARAIIDDIYILKNAYCPSNYR